MLKHFKGFPGAGKPHTQQAMQPWTETSSCLEALLLNTNAVTQAREVCAGGGRGGARARGLCWGAEALQDAPHSSLPVGLPLTWSLSMMFL